jgi:curli biogenesis system outer membrane secretion channel CsgG
MKKVAILVVILFLVQGCATVDKPMPVKSKEIQAAALVSQAQTLPEKVYKRKIAVARFTNETNYGRALLSEQAYGQIGKQVSDMLVNRLVRSDHFLVYEKPDLEEPAPMSFRADVKINLSDKDSNPSNGSGGEGTVPGTFEDYVAHWRMPGVDTLIIGAVTEFGRSDQGKRGLFSSTKIQTARAKVEVRLIDVQTGHAYFSASGTGQASTESGGFSGEASYDATLNDRALGAAVSDMIDDLISHMESRPWKSVVLKLDNDVVYISGGTHQGIKVGDKLSIMKYGELVDNPQTGRMDLRLPASKAADVEVTSLFGTDELAEGSACKVISGQYPAGSKDEYFVCEVK